MLKINNCVLVDIGLNLLGKKIKKGISSITGSWLTLKAGLALIKIVLVPLAKSVLIPFGFSAGMPEADGPIQKESDG